MNARAFAFAKTLALSACQAPSTTPPVASSTPQPEPADPDPADAQPAAPLSAAPLSAAPLSAAPLPSHTLVLPLGQPVAVDASGVELVLMSVVMTRVEPRPGRDEAGDETGAILDLELRTGEDPIPIQIHYAGTPTNPSGLPVTQRVGSLELTLLAVDDGYEKSATVVLRR